MTDKENIRYARHLVLDNIGSEGQSKLAQSKVLIIGIGGLGCPVSQYLSAAGVGNLGLVDGDAVSMSNLQRQILFNENDVTKNKAEVAQQKLSLLNPNVQIKAYPYYINSENIIELFKDFDVIADCSDNFSTRYLVNDAAVKLDKPFVYAALHKFQGQLSVFNYKMGPSYRCLFPEDKNKQEGLNCNEVGVWSVLPGIMGTLQANEIMKILVGLGDILSGKLFTLDSTNNKSLTLNFRRVEEQIQIAENSILESEACFSNSTYSLNYTEFCSVIKNDVDLIDLREKHEYAATEFNKAQRLPFSDIKNWIDYLSTKDIYLYCTAGNRSAAAVKLLREKGLKAFDLKGGLKNIEERNYE